MTRTTKVITTPSGLKYRFHFYSDGSVIVEAKGTCDRRFYEMADLEAEAVSVILKHFYPSVGHESKGVPA